MAAQEDNNWYIASYLLQHDNYMKLPFGFINNSRQ